jgi:DNA-binding SARP family transcriptional activator
MEFRLLGTVEVRDGARAIALGEKQRALLAILLLHANEVVPAERLIDLLWGESPPATAGHALHVHVSKLRAALGGELPETRAPGYAARVEHDAVDVHRFERLFAAGRDALTAGDAEGAAQTLREALTLWRGRALADVDAPFARAAAARLEELRTVALEHRIDADLACGLHAELVPELEELVRAEPYRERPRAQLMLALYRAGRQADALDAYREARRVLVGDLGLEPGPALQRLEKAILAHDPSLDLDERRTQPARSILVAPLDLDKVDALLAVARPLAIRPPRAILVAAAVAGAAELAQVSSTLNARRDATVRTAAFTSHDVGADLVRLAAEQDVDLVLADAPADLAALPPALVTLLERAPADVALVATRSEAVGDGPVLAPFAGADHDWAAVEVAAWIARARDATLRLVGTAATADRRDASRLLASASLIVQRAVGVATEPLLVEPGAASVVAAADDAAVVVAGLSERWRREGIGEARLALARDARPPVLLVRRGLRPSGVAPQASHTRFTWSLSGAR